ncbi:MAG TPA: ATP-grasp domain-containing protein [Planctomycetota bacterium]|nr:ATP-grasp domain-containing protein [Planctomycetota bacterium]
MARTSTPRLLVLFHGSWEEEALFDKKRRGELLLEREGFELLSFPHCLRLVWFDARRHAERLCAAYRGRIDAVWSNDDGFGCLLAAIVAARLGLPGNDPRAVVRAQHKLVLRGLLAQAVPEATVPAFALPFGLGDRRCRDATAIDAAVRAAGRSWPLFAKPVKGTFSALAARVQSAAELAEHLALPSLDRFVLRGLMRPFEQLAREWVELPCSVDRVLLEQPMDGDQVNVDGYVEDGEVHLLGIVDEWMYEKEVARARHFAGFTYPSRQPDVVQQRVRAAAAAAIRAVGFRRGLFNIEMFVLRDGSVRVIEINPRSAAQFATMYREVDGIDVEGIGIALALGEPGASVKRVAPTAGAAASFVFRRFDGTHGPMPAPGAEQWLAATHPRARLWLERSNARALRREYRWFGSHRYAVLNFAAQDFPTLMRQGAECGERLFGVGPLPLP